MADDQQAQAANGDPQGDQQGDKQLLLQKIYVKDLSFESPRAPDVFTTTRSPQTQLNIRSSNAELDPENVEVTLTLTVESKQNDETLFLIEISQCGIFLVKGYTADERAVLIGSFCPATLYPFAREAISDIAVKGGFPQLLLQPINFDALYAQAVRQRSEQGETAQQPQPAASGEPQH